MDRFEENEAPRREIDQIETTLKVRYFKSSDIPVIEKRNIDYLVMKSETNSEALLYYRNLGGKFKLKVNLEKSPFIMVMPVKSILNENFSYNCHFSLKHANHSFKQIKKKLKAESSIYPILPLETSRVYFLNKKQWKFGSKLPSILAQFERFVLIHEFVKSRSILSLPANEEEIKHFTAAVTSPAVTEDYSFQILETLGDSVLKFLITYHFFDKYPKFTEGEISKNRNDITKNNYLFEKGRNSCLIKYIYSSPINLKNWDPPLKFKHVQQFEFSITKKTMADVVEAVMGACFLSREMFNSCLVYLKYIDILAGKNDFSDVFLKKLLGFTETSFINIEFLNVEYESDISFYDLFNIFNYYKGEDDFQPEIIQSSSEIKDIGRNFKGCDLNNVDKIEKTLENLEGNILNYKFVNKGLLRNALTHKSVNISDSYERLEILGDAIVEIYIMSTIFHLSKKTINMDENFNPGNLSKVKAFLSSNYFLLRLSVFFKFHENMMITSKLKKKIEEAENYIKQINFSQKLNEYEDTIMGRPKFISDIFEAVIGAVFIDSDLNMCFKLLNMLIGPFVVYCAKYLGKLKYSPIAELVELTQEFYKSGPIFKVTKIAETNEIQVNIFVGENQMAKGKGLTEDSAKEAACINCLKKFKVM